MQASTIKWIDRRVGTVLCRLFSILNGLWPVHRRKFFSSRKVLFIKLIEQGASVLAYSALKEAIEEYGKENIYFMVFEENRFILDYIELLDEENILVIRNDSPWNFAVDMVAALVKCRKLRIDSAIDMEFFSRASALIAYLSGAKKRVGLYSFTSEHPYRGNLITHKIHYNPYIHISQYYTLLVRALKSSFTKEPLLKDHPKDFEICLPKKKFEEAYLHDLRSKFGLGKDFQYVILNPNASDMLPLRKWDSSKFSALAKELIQWNEKIRLVFTGLEGERAAIEQFIDDKNRDKFINLAGKTSLNELMGLYQICDLIVTNDSGPAHFASMFDIQIVVLFGPETPQLFAPVGDKVHVIYKDLACSPCVNAFNHRFSPCTNNICMQQIEVSDVMQKVKSIM